MVREVHEQQHELLRKALGMGSVTLLGVGALLGGGIFTLLGTSIGLAGGGGMLIAILLLGTGMFGIVLFYAELGTAFPEAGGGYLWIREGLSDLQGFLAGWISWFAHAAAAGLYSLSFGFYITLALELFSVELPFPPDFTRIAAAVAILGAFGFINWKGVGTVSKTANGIAVAVLLLLGVFAAAGALRIFAEPAGFAEKLNGSLFSGITGILAAMSFFFIAFEGSEIQTQAAEEMKNAGRDLPRALLVTHGAIMVVYLLITAAILAGFPAQDQSQTAAAIGEAGEHALARAAGNLLPFGAVFIVFGGLLVNIAALNATIFSSSHVALAMARSRHIFRELAAIHVRNKTPHRAVVLSTIAIVLLAVFFPLREIASVTDLLFILLFLQTVVAFIALRRNHPETVRPFRAPLAPVLSFVTAAFLLLLAIFLVTHVSALAGYVVGMWILFGLVNYFAYSQPMERNEIESSTVFEQTWRMGEETHWRLLLPLASTEHGADLAHFAFALAKKHETGEVTILRVDETPGDHHPHADEPHAHDHALDETFLAHVVKLGEHHALSMRALILESADPGRAILGYIRLNHINLAILGWDGLARHGRIFTKKVDSILREAGCDLVVVKLKDLENLKRIFIAVPPDGGPHLRYVSSIAKALAESEQGAITLGTVIPHATSFDREETVRQMLSRALARMRLPWNTPVRIIRSASRVEGILSGEDEFDVIMLGAGRDRLFREIRVGRVPEQVARRSKKTVIIAKGHQGIVPPFFQYLRERW